MHRNEQIVRLCQELLQAKTDEDSLRLASQLKAALHEHVETIRGDLLVSVAPRDAASEEIS